MGEDVGRYGGAFGVSLGLLEQFGPERIRDTPLSVGLRRSRHRCGDRRAASDRRGHDRQLQPARPPPDPEQRGDAAAHVRRAGGCHW
ncbi:hypothetical protein OG469_05465 [Kitasatospora herbaricolor]|uniref:Uncharacterized protein n=1 Tax=Kitasatospora herbaricolor TaxID=68217 RepID=A0ABZ1WKH8_9ACTN